MRIKGFCTDCGEPLTKSEVDLCAICTRERISEREKQDRKRIYRR